MGRRLPDDMDGLFHAGKQFVARRYPSRRLVRLALYLDDGERVRLPVPLPAEEEPEPELVAGPEQLPGTTKGTSRLQSP
jgi:hypothetical protein